MVRSLYPANWEEIALRIKQTAEWKCQGCGKECRRRGESLVDFISRTGGTHSSSDFEKLSYPQRFTLTVAHLNHIPADCRPENLKALCAPCHGRMDLRAMPLKKWLKREREGQLSLPL